MFNLAVNMHAMWTPFHASGGTKAGGSGKGSGLTQQPSGHDQAEYTRQKALGWVSPVVNMKRNHLSRGGLGPGVPRGCGIRQRVLSPAQWQLAWATLVGIPPVMRHVGSLLWQGGNVYLRAAGNL